MIVYGRNPVREALRGPRTVHRVWATKNARCASRGWRVPACRVSITGAEEIERRCGSDDHQGICAEVSRRFATPTPTRCWRGPAR